MTFKDAVAKKYKIVAFDEDFMQRIQARYTIQAEEKFIHRAKLIKFIDDNYANKTIRIEFINSKGSLQTAELESYDDKRIKVDGIHFSIDLRRVDMVALDDDWYYVVPPAKEEG